MPGHNEVIEHPHINEGKRLFECLGKGFIGVTRLGDPGGVIVAEDPDLFC